ncbi:hypothetical protein [Nisaea sediminum]|uniref:hypothetical protein n=1 Tax=Nisaea sediminum TaxID=2775867 RepID=UPI001868F2B5|nr:hypothetical protein [Nisaea sediminum]
MAGTKRVRVFVATTRGAVRVVRISAENPAVRSALCLSGSLAALPVSADYDSFVREPTGVVERLTGHPVYRTDLSAAIDGGESWQLGLFLAHMLKREDLLAEGDAPAETDLLVTGRVDRDLNVGAVDHVGAKLERAGTAASGHGFFVLPASGDIPDSTEGWSLLPVDHPEQALLACLGPDISETLFGASRQTSPDGKERAGPRKRSAVMAGIAVAGGLTAILYGSINRYQEAEPERESVGAGSMMQVEIVPREQLGCGVPVVLPPKTGVFDGAACAGIVTVRRNGEFRIRASVSGGFLTYADADRYRRELHRVAAGGDQLVLRIDFPYWMRQPLRLDVEVTQLAMDGQPVQFAGRSIELRPSGHFHY